MPTYVGGARTIIKDSHQGLLPNEKSAFAAGKLFATPRGYDTENKPSHEVLNEMLTRICFGRYDPLSKMTAMLQVNKQFLPDDRYGHSMHCLSP
jgi:hypothetical protein